MKKDKRKIGTLDLETDPFQYGRTPLPFAAGFYNGDVYHQTWGDNCVAEMMEYLEDLPPHKIYVHNGGGFDFWYMQNWITNPLFFIKTRLAKCGLLSKHELRDSYRMIPVPLGDYQKEKIDYNLFWYPTREKYKKEIGYYLQMDCEYLYQLVMDFINRYGEHLTIGSAAIKQLKKLHPQKHESEAFDERFRPFYMGGRNEVFERGELRGDFKIYDVNSMYPYVMASYQHPLGGSFMHTKKIRDNRITFARITATSNGALPIYVPRKGLKFIHGRETFWACSHEIHAGIDLGVLRVEKIHDAYMFNQSQNFSSFVDKFNALKVECDRNGDKGGRLFAKLLLNSSYGKFGQNPRNYTDCELFDDYSELLAAGYKPNAMMGDHFIGVKPCEIRPYSFNNVAIAASITSAARAELMRGIANAVRPVYCDTDSIICEGLEAPMDDSRLGAWKLEAQCDGLYVAGKKLYAAYQAGSPLLIKGKEKKACKGANLSASTIRDIALGKEFLNQLDVPALKIGQPAKFTARNIRATA